MSFISDGLNLLHWTMYGNTVQNGTPTPTAPVPVQGVGDIDGTAYKIPISTGDSTTIISLGGVQTTRKIKKLVLTGAVMAISSMKNNMRATGRCSHFTPTFSPSTETGDAVCFGASNNLLYLLFSDSTASALNITNLDSIKQWLQVEYANGTPVCVWYVLAQPETSTVNEPLHKIGNYADSISDVATIPTVSGINTLSVDTVIQPSNMIIQSQI